MIELDNVTMQFGLADAEPFTALKNLNLRIRDNEFVSVLGPSGCGKTTLLKLVAGLNTPTGGEIRIDGQPISGPGPDRAVAFQDFVLLPWADVLKNVSFGLALRKVPKKERVEIAREQLRKVGLTGFENNYPHELSGGMQQRVGIARALAVNPSTLLMDEPFGALDALTRQIMQADLLRLWQEEQKTVIFITHSIDEAIFLSDRIVVMGTSPGRVLEVFDVPLPRPRDESVRQHPEFGRMATELWDLLTSQILPDRVAQ